MKNTILFFLLLAFLPNVNAQTKDSITVHFESDFLIIHHNHSKNTFAINSKKEKKGFANLKYLQSVGSCYQAIDENNDIFFIGMNVEKKEEAENMYWLCGTVNHYTLKVEETKNSFVITRDETFFDMGDQDPPKEMVTIPKKDAEEVLFINGQNTFDYTGNFSFTTRDISPTTIFLLKDGKYSILDEKGIQYDSVDFTSYAPTLKYSVNNLHGFHNITEAKYKELGDFQENLARVTTADGRKIIIDKKGNEYF